MLPRVLSGCAYCACCGVSLRTYGSRGQWFEGKLGAVPLTNKGGVTFRSLYSQRVSFHKVSARVLFAPSVQPAFCLCSLGLVPFCLAPELGQRFG